MKRILIDIGHPGHVHLFKNLAHRFIAEGHKVLFTARDKECELQLIAAEGFEYESFGKHYKTLPGKLWGLLKFDLQMIRCAMRFKPDLLLSHGSIYAAHAGGLLGIKHLSLEDSGNMEQIYLYRPFTDVILTSDIFKKSLGPKQMRYNGYHELAYLHPQEFKPNKEIYNLLQIEEQTPFALLRLISWNASHDLGQKGLSNDFKVKLVKHLEQNMKVFICAENDIPAELEPYQLSLAPEKLHDALAAAQLVISEGATIAAEASVLGTPSIYINSIQLDYCKDLEAHGLMYNVRSESDILTKVGQIVKKTSGVYQTRKEKMLAQKINVTAFLYQFINKRYFSSISTVSDKVAHAV